MDCPRPFCWLLSKFYLNLWTSVFGFFTSWVSIFCSLGTFFSSHQTTILCSKIYAWYNYTWSEECPRPLCCYSKNFLHSEPRKFVTGRFVFCIFTYEYDINVFSIGLRNVLGNLNSKLDKRFDVLAPVEYWHISGFGCFLYWGKLQMKHLQSRSFLSTFRWCSLQPRFCGDLWTILVRFAKICSLIEN